MRGAAAVARCGTPASGCLPAYLVGGLALPPTPCTAVPPALPAPSLQTSVYLASSPEVEGLSGKYFDKCRPVSSSAESYDLAVAQRLWDVSAKLVGL